METSQYDVILCKFSPGYCCRLTQSSGPHFLITYGKRILNDDDRKTA